MSVLFGWKAMIPQLIFVQIEKDSVVRPKANYTHALKYSAMHCSRRPLSMAFDTGARQDAVARAICISPAYALLLPISRLVQATPSHHSFNVQMPIPRASSIPSRAPLTPSIVFRSQIVSYRRDKRMELCEESNRPHDIHGRGRENECRSPDPVRWS